MWLLYHVKEDFTRDTALDTVEYVVEVKDWTDAAVCSEETSNPRDAEDDTVLKVVDVKLCTDAAL